MTKPDRMDKEEFRNTLTALGLATYSAAAAQIGVSERTAAGYGSGDMRIPVPTAKLLRLWLQIKRNPGRAKLPFTAKEINP